MCGLECSAESEMRPRRRQQGQHQQRLLLPVWLASSLGPAGTIHSPVKFNSVQPSNILQVTNKTLIMEQAMQEFKENSPAVTSIPQKKDAFSQMRTWVLLATSISQMMQGFLKNLINNVATEKKFIDNLDDQHLNSHVCLQNDECNTKQLKRTILLFRKTTT